MVQNFSLTNRLKDRLIKIGTDATGKPLLVIRLIEIRHGQRWYRYLTSVVSPEVLPPYVVADIYSRRWRARGFFSLGETLIGTFLSLDWFY